MKARESDVDVLARQNKTLDIATLCSKLEAYKREQDVVRVRKEKRDALRTGRVIPKAAARPLNATTPSPREDLSRRSHRSAPLAPIAEPIVHSLTAEPEPVYAAMNYVVKGQDGIATLVAETKVSRPREASKRDSMSPTSEGRASNRRSAGQDSPLGSRQATAPVTSIPHRPTGHLDVRPRVPQRSSSQPEVKQPEHRPQHEANRIRTGSAEAKELDTSLYRPGDAARRRSMLELFPKDSAIVTPAEYGRRTSIHALQELHLSQYNNATLPVVEESDQNLSDNRQRPKLAPHDRHDWCQSSQNGDTPKHFFPRMQKKGDDAGAARGRSNMLPESMFGETEPAAKAQKGHLIADAVKIIKDQEKLQKRKSVIGFFKKL
ncbi:hypothetical protein Slin15195_G016790 [Septoria linicola]|uniref:Uncharacterized protein n=1 Tax=Septoria linicola TaxID=215465 RepID=A0A9Q9EEY4_9PEZI|nr:hypothetical protein Slin14017_G016850 [Septoria linicola]USW48360.1 hypothetical protein Slin15195_G016790 [Septoria linicola]